MSSVDGNSAAAALPTGGMLILGNEHRSEADINHFHGSLSPFIWVF